MSSTIDDMESCGFPVTAELLVVYLQSGFAGVAVGAAMVNHLLTIIIYTVRYSVLGNRSMWVNRELCYEDIKR